ncbi:Ribosomal protein S6 modification protein [compost metagenome]
MIPSDRGPLVLEVNSSPGLEGIEKATKKDIASEIIQYIERQYEMKQTQMPKVVKKKKKRESKL